jgi:hypothetical protein
MLMSREAQAMICMRCALSAVALSLTAVLAGCGDHVVPDEMIDAGVVDAAGDARSPGPLPLITEFLARNQAGLTDEDGAASDWIEIHNPDNAPFDLSGYHLTDTRTNRKRWAFPEGTVLPPGGYLVVFASGKDRAVAGKPLHTNFSLASGERAGCARRSGEYLALTDRMGAPLPPEWDPYPAQAVDVSYGLLERTAASSSAFFAAPTPGAPNNAAAALAGPVLIDPPGRTFSAGTTLQVTLSLASPTATIRYTTNRSRPIDVAGMTGTFTADAATDVCKMTAHGLVNGDLVRVSGPRPLDARGNYFALVLDADTFKLAVEPGGPAVDLAVDGSFEVRRDAATGTAATTDLITTTAAHPFFNGDPVQVRAADTLPAGLSAGTTYYVVVNSATTLRLSASPTLTPVVDITSTGKGPLTVFRLPSPVYTGPIPVSVNTRVRARAFEPGRPAGPIASTAYFAIDAAAQAFTSNLPLVVSNTWNTAMGNDVTVDGYLMIFEPKPPDNLARLTNPPDLVSPCTLERRGSSTAGEAKFSMTVELQDEDGIDQSCSPLGMPAHADWVLHAPYRYDRAMIRNDLTYRLSNDAGRYAPRTKLVEHIHNEQSLSDTIEGAVSSMDYFGVYSFMEKISRGAERVDVENLTLADNTLPAIQGGYIFKVDRLDPGDTGIVPLPGQSFGKVSSPTTDVMAWVTPRETSLDPFKRVTAAQSDWFRGYVGEAWAALSGPNFDDPVSGYAKYWDVGAAIDHHILNTATRNADAFRLSAYWHKPRLGKLTAGPLWDFDRAQGSTDGRDFHWGIWSSSGGTFFFDYPWYREMFNDPNFWQAWIDRLHQLRQGPLATAAVHARIDELVNQINPGDGADTPVKRSIARWPLSAARTSASNTAITNDCFDGQYTGEVAWLKYWWEHRLEFMDSQVTRPPVADLPPGRVPAGSTVTLTSPSLSVPGARIYYTLDGTDPRSRVPGEVYTPGAIEYTEPIAITGPTRLFARAWSPDTPSPIGSGWSAPTVLSYTP